jgi:hypothetical protein
MDDLCLFMEPKCSLGRFKRVDECTVLDGLGIACDLWNYKFQHGFLAVSKQSIP